MSERYNYESVIIDNKSILEFRESMEREIRFCTDAMKKMAAKIQELQMLDGFEGEAAESIKSYFSEVHLFLLEAIAEALTEFESMLNQYTMDILCNVDSSPYARIPVSDLLGMRDQVKNKYLDMDETIDSVNELMNGIRDLIPMEPIQTERKAGGLGTIAIPKKEPLTYGYDYNDMLESSIHYGNCSSLLEDCEEIRSVLNQKAEMIDRITFDYAMDKLPIIQDYVEVLEGSLAEYSCVSRDMEGYQTGDYKKWETTSYLSDQMLLFSLYYTANQEEILAAKETLQQVSIEMHLAEEKEKKDDQMGAVKEVSSFGISLIPGLGDAKDLQEAIGGMDLITGKKLSALERVLAGACVIVPVVSGSMVRIAGKNANIAEKMSLLSEKQLFRKGAKAGITMCEDAKKEMEQIIREIHNILEEDVDIKRLFAKSQNTGPQVEIAGVGKVSLEEAEKLVGKDVRWSVSKSGINSIDDIALKHSSVGDFTYNPKTGQISRMKGGGHGQSNINFLEENGIEYNIVKEYDNGVRVGNVPKHKTPSKRTGTGQAWFPKNWSDSKIKEAGKYVTNLPDNKNLPDGVIGYGEYDGVRVGIIKTDGKIGTIFPDADLQP